MSQNRRVKKLTVNKSACFLGQTVINPGTGGCGGLRLNTDVVFKGDLYVKKLITTNTGSYDINGIVLQNGNILLDCKDIFNGGNLEVDQIIAKTNDMVNVNSILNFETPTAKLIIEDGVRLGDNSTSTNNSNGIAIGKNANAGDNSVSIGSDAGTTDSQQNVNIGKEAGNMSSGTQNVNIGQHSSSINNVSKAITIGCDAMSNHDGAIVLGPGISGESNKLHLNFPSGGDIVTSAPTLVRPAFLTICINGRKFEVSGLVADQCYYPTLSPFSLMASGPIITGQNMSDNSMQQQANVVDKYTGPNASNGGFLIEYSAPGESTEIPGGALCPTNWAVITDNSYNTNAQVVGASIGGKPYSTKAFVSSTVDNNGKILASENWNVYRFNTNGTLDVTFGVGGIVDLSIPTFNTPGTPQIDEGDGWSQIVVAPDNSIFVVGSAQGPIVNRAIVRKLTPFGTIDNTFGINGSYIDNAAFYTAGYAMTLTITGDIIIAGYDGFNGNVARHSIIKVTSAGVLDTGFGTNGYARIPFVQYNPEGELRGVGIDSNGKIVAGGYFSTGAGASFRIGAGVVRFNTNGSIDTTYGTGGSGWGFYSHNIYDGYYYTARLINDEMFVGGTHEVPPNGYLSTLVKFNSNGLLDITWRLSGTLITQINLNTGIVRSILPTCDGGLLVGGSTHVYSNIIGSFIYKLNSVGNFDTSWGTSGIYTLGTNSTFYSLNAYDSTDLEIYAAGYGPPGSGLNGTITKLVVDKPNMVLPPTYSFNYVPGLFINDFSNTVPLTLSMYNVPYTLYHSINVNPNPPIECPAGWLVKNTPILQWEDATNVMLTNNGTTMDVSWNSVMNAYKYAVSVTVEGVASVPVTHYYGTIVSAPTTNVTLSTSQTGNTTSYWSSVSSVTARVVGYQECDESKVPLERCLDFITFGVTGTIISTINYALASNGSTATATATYPNVVFSPSKVIDGLLEDGSTQNNYWLSPDGVSGVTLTVDLGSQRIVSVIKVVNSRNAIYLDRSTNAYRLGISTDGINFTIVQTGNLTQNDIVNRVVTSFPETLVRYVRFYMDTYYGAGGGLSELEVFGNQLHVTATTSEIKIGQSVTGPGILPGTYIVGQNSGIPGGIGNYRLNQYPIGPAGPNLTFISAWNL